MGKKRLMEKCISSFSFCNNNPHSDLLATLPLTKEREWELTLSHNLVKNSIYVLIFHNKNH